jgi:hypothetical protein
MDGSGEGGEGTERRQQRSEGIASSRQKFLNRFGAKAGVDRGAGDQSMAEPSLECPGVVALVGEGRAAGSGVPAVSDNRAPVLEPVAKRRCVNNNHAILGRKSGDRSC